MVRNGESWDLGDVESNEQGQPVIHDIAEKLGCVRQLPDTLHALPEEVEILADLKEHFDRVEETYRETTASNEPVSSLRDPLLLRHQQCQRYSHYDEQTQPDDEPEFGKVQEMPALNLRVTTSSLAHSGLRDHHLNLESSGNSDTFRPWTCSVDEPLVQVDLCENDERDMLDCYMGFDVAGDMDNILFGQSESYRGLNMS